MSWNHRVIRHGPDSYALHECFYERLADHPHSWTVDPVVVSAESIHGLKMTLKWMANAFKLPVLEEYKDGDVDKLREVT